MSIPNRRPRCIEIERNPSTMSAQETPMQIHLTRRKSMCVFLKSSIVRSALNGDALDALARAVLQHENRLRDEDRGEHRSAEAHDEGHGEALHRAGTELEEKQRRH